MDSIRGVSKEHFSEFIENNGELEKLELIFNNVFDLDCLHNRLPLLKFLEIVECGNPDNIELLRGTKIALPSLETLKIDKAGSVRVLQALESPELKELRIRWREFVDFFCFENELGDDVVETNGDDFGFLLPCFVSSND